MIWLDPWALRWFKPPIRVGILHSRSGAIAISELTVVTTDFGADCDDQKAVSGLIAGLKAGTEIAFIVNGPQPRLAAAAIAEAYHEATGAYPLITTGRQFGEDKKPQDRIHSLLDGTSIGASSALVDNVLVSPDQFQSKIADGKSHMETMASELGKLGARAVMYDAVAVEASRVVRNNSELRQYFTEEGTGILNTSADAVKSLKEKNRAVYAVFEDGVRTGLTRDGGQLAIRQTEKSGHQ